MFPEMTRGEAVRRVADALRENRYRLARSVDVDSAVWENVARNCVDELLSGSPCPHCGKEWINGTCESTVSRRALCAQTLRNQDAS